jgi:hypothetical protein
MITFNNYLSEKTSLKIIDKTSPSSTYSANNITEVKFIVEFPNGDKYEEHWQAPPIILRKFIWMVETKGWPLKAYQFLKKNKAKTIKSKKVS